MYSLIVAVYAYTGVRLHVKAKLPFPRCRLRQVRQLGRASRTTAMPALFPASIKAVSLKQFLAVNSSGVVLIATATVAQSGDYR